MIRLLLLIAVVLLSTNAAHAQQIMLYAQPSPLVTVYQPRTVWVPQTYAVQHQIIWRQSWLFPRMWRQRRQVIYTPIPLLPVYPSQPVYPIK